ncbi:MAG TPA: manganese efflux pump [Candidatus Blautia stercoripullorum]|uniref:Manganese efflux pump n=1 Tax=Candidatus Blautia stercoripullorum TaxID=2838502 RepID=A0A9D2U4U8_9FIRM|nr:manganese efflux pump [Candidatus Blautia stercoripullorum]
MNGIAFLNGVLLIAALTTDSFVVSFSYGVRNVRIPFKYVLVMNMVMSWILAGGLWTGSLMERVFPRKYGLAAGGIVLLGMGAYRIGKGFLKKEKKEERIKEMSFFQAVFMAVLLSLDGLAAGIGTGLAEIGGELLISGTFAGGILMMIAGWKTGRHFQRLFQRDLSWVSGVCLLTIGVGILCKL